MRTFRIRMAVALACCGFVVSGCPSSEERFCNRADECNILPPGTSTEDCTDTITQCTEDLTSSERADWYNAIGDCLELKSCSNFVNCYGGVPSC